MYDCSTILKLIQPYLDRELDVKESFRVQEHLRGCDRCRTALIAEQEFKDLVRASVSPQPAPAFSRQCISAALSREVRLREPRRYRRLLSPPWLGAALAVASAMAFVLFVLLKGSGDPVPDLVKWAVAEHRQFLHDPSWLQVTSSDPQAVSRWLYDQHFNIALPPLKLEHITLIGARAASQETDRAAYIAYRVGNERVSLLATTPKEVRLTGRDVVAFQNILFHPATVDGYYTLQWSDNQHTYVLVSKRPHAVHQACAVCHGDVRSREMEEGFAKGI